MVIPFEKQYREKYYQSLNEIFDSSQWSNGEFTRKFENKFSEYTGLSAKSISSGGTGLLAILEYVDVKDKEVIVPTNTFWATSVAVKKAGGNVIYADCNKNDLCLSYNDMINKITPNTKAVIVVHIGGHIAFEIEKIADYCRKNNIYLIEDCAHAHGAEWNGKMAGSWGFAGSYSFYATKTMPLGDGGMVVSKDIVFLEWIEKYKNYGKEIVNNKVQYPVKNGFNYRITEMAAALGIIQLERLPMILKWKRNLAKKFDEIFDNRVKFPNGMISGYYKYIIFDYNLKEETGKVFGYTDLGHIIEALEYTLPNSEWVSKHHRCVPIYYGWDNYDKEAENLKKFLVNS